ncbi:MAG: DUF664 domain-containing protein [Flavobacteriales bacterium]|nr:DUF664 domain-containing protein [Flavobacteriales bacterium]
MSLLAEQLRTEACRRLEESLARVEKCVGMLNDEQLWHRPNANLVSVGNLVLHLAGNAAQWINSALGGVPDERNRNEEFDQHGPVDRDVLLAGLRMTIDRARTIIRYLDEARFESLWAVQGFQESGTAIILHVVEHFSYHTGQITLHTKLLLNVDTGYYAGQDLNASG